jgi:DNA-binding response OmpR family regulator
MKILIIEDDKLINDNITAVFRANGFVVEQAYDGKVASDKLKQNNYDCMIVDINLPFISGLEVVRDARARGVLTPAIFLTARDSFKDKEAAFVNGADDYLVKPFDLNVLILKVRALLARVNSQGKQKYQIGDLSVDLVKKEAVRNTRVVDLTAKEYLILEYLLVKVGQYISAEEILEHVWGEEVNDFSQTVKIHISNLRKKIGDVIEVKRGVGYRIILL